MRSIVFASIVAVVAVAGLGTPPAHADILDDILGIATAARDRATQARDNAANARDRATEARNYAQTARDNAANARDNAASARDSAITARDTAIDMRNNMQAGLSALSANILNAIDEAMEDLEADIQNELEGRDAFVNGGQAEPFRQNLIHLFQSTATLLNTEYDLAGMSGAHVDFSNLISVIQALPARGLYPMFRATSVETNLFGGGGLTAQMDSTVANLQIVAPILQRLNCDEEAPILDQEVCECSLVLDHLSAIKHASSGLRLASSALTLVGRYLEAHGETHIHKQGALWGWAGVSIEENTKKKVGIFFEGAGESVHIVGEFVETRINHCTSVAIALEARERELKILANQEDILNHLKNVTSDRW